jgi:hypothetical protein
MKLNYSGKRLLFFILIFPLFISNYVIAQQVRVEILLTPTLHNAQVVYLSNFDFLQLSTAEFLFQVTITNSGNAVNGRLKFLVNKDGTELVLAITNPFNLPPTPPVISFSNIDLSNGYTLNEQTVKFDETDISYPPGDFEKEIYQGGRLPAGKYFFTAIFEAEGVSESHNTEVIDVLNSPFVLPVAPGAADYTNPEIVYTQFPVFQFNSNITDPLALLDDPFLIQVYQKEEYHTTADEVLSSTPYLEKSIGTTLYQYPQGEGEQPLEPGTYVWRVKLLLNTTNGIEEISSPLYTFKYVDPASASEDVQKQILTADIFRLLKYLLGSRADEIAKSLNNYNISVMYINGEKIDISALYNQINSYQGKVLQINDLELLSSQE